MATTFCGSTIIVFIITVTGVKVITADYTYLGCYQDSTSNPDLTGSYTAMANLTVQSCASTCRSQGFAYAGIQEGSKCFCGDTYNQRGPSSGCTTCASPNHCGGVLANDVYYTEDTSISGRVPVANSLATSFVNARRVCIKNNGDLIPPTSQQLVANIVQLFSGTSVTSVWVGLWKKTNITVMYDWADESVQPRYVDASYSSYWTAGDAKVELCVSLVIATSKFKSTPCDAALAFVCNQPSSNPSANSGDGSATTPSSGDSAKKKRLALFIVLPIFLFCYGGSCILYCVHKIIKNCTKRKVPEKPPMDNANRYTDRPPRRPLSASRGRVFPMPPPVTLDMPGKAMPSYIPQTGGLGGKSGPDYKPGMERPSSSSGVNIMMGGNLLAPPPYDDQKRAELLENAARESRERRAKEEAEGRPSPRPFADIPKKGDGDGSPRVQASPLSTGSTVNLLGKPGHDEDDEEDRLGNNSPLSINEILKRKVQEKKKPKKIVTT